MLFKTDDTITLVFQVIAVALAIVLVVVGAAYGGMLLYLNQMSDVRYTPNEAIDVNSTGFAEGDATPAPTAETTLAPVDEETPVPVTPDPAIAAKLKKLKDNILAWRDTGSPVRNDNVLNILLIGMDVDDDLSKNSRADAMTIMSVNHNTGEITLASILRDQFCYVEHGSSGSFTKLHHANIYGGPSLQIKHIEMYYKVCIDNYAIVNFASLPKAIDCIGGVTINVTKDESSYLKSKCGLAIEPGENTLDGGAALVYMRIRKGNTGGEEARVGRQRKVIQQILNKVHQMDAATLTELVTQVVPYIRTGYSASQMLSLALQALGSGWLDYEIKQVTLPGEGCCTEWTYNGGWYWKTDFPLAARKLQKALYGTTNITLDENRESWLK